MMIVGAAHAYVCWKMLGVSGSKSPSVEVHIKALNPTRMVPSRTRVLSEKGT